MTESYTENTQARSKLVTQIPVSYFKNRSVLPGR